MNFAYTPYSRPGFSTPAVVLQPGYPLPRYPYPSYSQLAPNHPYQPVFPLTFTPNRPIKFPHNPSQKQHEVTNKYISLSIVTGTKILKIILRITIKIILRIILRIILK